jgi:putative ABC transport system substrate-binding protein
VKRREFITALGGAAVAWPLAARAQQPDRMRRVGVLTSLAEHDAEARAWAAGFERRLLELGWTSGRNLRLDYRFGLGAGERVTTAAAELVGTAPDAILAVDIPPLQAVRRATQTIPIVFVMVPDPIGAGIVTSLARPEGNLTGFTHYEYSTAGKWLEALKEIAPDVRRALVLARNPTAPPGSLALAAVEAAGRKLEVQVEPAVITDATSIERAINSFAGAPNSGLIALAHIVAIANRDLIVALAARHRLPGSYPHRHFATAGGLVSYNIDAVEQFRQAAAYVDRILKGAKPGDLPIQQPSKFELVINLKTAKALGLTVPPSLLARADEVIE